MVIETRPDWDDLIWKIAQVTARLHDEQGDRALLLLERASLWKEAEEIGLFLPKYK